MAITLAWSGTFGGVKPVIFVSGPERRLCVHTRFYVTVLKTNLNVVAAWRASAGDLRFCVRLVYKTYHS